VKRFSAATPRTLSAMTDVTSGMAAQLPGITDIRNYRQRCVAGIPNAALGHLYELAGIPYTNCHVEPDPNPQR
ncbi:hypothetical protein ACKI1S_48590, partial [Streptomyces galilaeus]